MGRRGRWRRSASGTTREGVREGAVVPLRNLARGAPGPPGPRPPAPGPRPRGASPRVLGCAGRISTAGRPLGREMAAPAPPLALASLAARDVGAYLGPSTPRLVAVRPALVGVIGDCPWVSRSSSGVGPRPSSRVLRCPGFARRRRRCCARSLPAASARPLATAALARTGRCTSLS